MSMETWFLYTSSILSAVCIFPGDSNSESQAVLVLAFTLVLFLTFMWFYCSPMCRANRLRRKHIDTESRGNVNKLLPPILSPPPAYISRSNSPAPDYSAQFQADLSVQPCDLLAFRGNDIESSAQSEICSSANITPEDISVQLFLDTSVLQSPTAPLPVVVKAIEWDSINGMGTISNVVAIRASSNLTECRD